MNPPFEGIIPKIGVSKVAYLWHLMKAILLLNYKKTIYIVSPRLQSNKTQFEFDEVIPEKLKISMLKYFNIEEIPKTIITPLLINVSGFNKIVFSRGKYTEQTAGLNFNLYKVETY